MDKEKQDGFVIGGGSSDNDNYGNSGYSSYGNVSTPDDTPKAGQSETASYYGDVSYGSSVSYDRSVSQNEPSFNNVNTGYSTDGYTSSGSDGGNYYDIPQQAPNSATHEVMAIISLISGILSLVCCCFAPLNGVAGVLGLVLGILAITVWKGRYNGLAIGGIVTSVIGIIIAALMLLGLAAVMEDVQNELDNYEYSTDYDDFDDEW